MRTLIAIILIVVGGFAYSYNPSLASFHIFQNEEGLSMRADFAWSVRNVLIETYPFFEDESKSNKEYLDCMMEYIQANISVEIDDHLLAFKGIYQIPGDHSHNYVYVLGINGSTVKITNTYLFEFYRNQKNLIFSITRDVGLTHKVNEICVVDMKSDTF